MIDAQSPKPVRLAATASYLPGPPLDNSIIRQLLRRSGDALTESMQDRIVSESGIM